MNTTKLREILGNAPGIWGVVIKPVGEPIVFEHHADEVFRAASVNKMPVALYLLHLVETGGARLDQSFTVAKEYYRDSSGPILGSGILQHLMPGLQPTLQDLIALMMIESDNIAAELLVKAYGAAEINSYVLSLGFEKTQLGIKHDDYDFGTTTPREMAAMLEGIYNAHYVGREYSDLLLDLMKECKNQLGIKRCLPQERPDGMKLEVANKSGAGDHVRNDVGIVFAERPYIITVFSMDLPVVSYKPDNSGALVIAELSEEVYTQLG